MTPRSEDVELAARLVRGAGSLAHRMRAEGTVRSSIPSIRAPFSTDSETSFVAMIPPNCLVRPLVSSTGDMRAPLAAEADPEALLQRDRAFGERRRHFENLRPHDAENWNTTWSPARTSSMPEPTSTTSPDPS